MGTTTTRLGLFKPDGTDFVDRPADLNANWDAIDAAMGFQRLGSFPGSPYSGKGIHRSDQNDRPYFFNATTWFNLQHDWRAVRKTADETLNNTTTMQNDDHLLVADFSINQSYWIDLFLRYISVTTIPDLKIGFTVPAGAVFSWAPWGADSTTAAETTPIRTVLETTGVRTIGTVAATEITARICGELIMGGTAGNLQTQWAQSAATAENTTVKAGSLLMGRRIT